MADVKCWDTQGKEFTKETVDARECVEHLGWTMARPNVPALKTAPAEVSKNNGIGGTAWGAGNDPAPVVAADPVVEAVEPVVEVAEKEAKGK